MFGGTETLRGDIFLAKRRIIDKLSTAKRPVIGAYENIRIGAKSLRQTGQNPQPQRHHRLVIGKNPLAKERSRAVRPPVRMDKRQPGQHIRIIRRHLAAPEEHLLGVMRCRAFEVGQPLRHPAALVAVNGDVALRRLVKREERAACRHRPGGQRRRDTMPRNIEEADLGRGFDKCLGDFGLALGSVHRRQVDHRDFAEINGARRGIGRRAGHRRTLG